MIIDTNSRCTTKVQFLVQRGVEIVGRYYSKNSKKAITREEAQALSASGIGIFTIYEDIGKASQFNLTVAQGQDDAGRAKTQAKDIGQPKGTVIYFAVEGLPHGYKPEHLPGIRDYFSGVTKTLGKDYTAGVYGDGLVCNTLLSEGVCSHTWLAQASWSFDGSQEFYKSKQWNLAQIVTDLPTDNWRGLSVDINEGSANTGSFLVKASVRNRSAAARR